MTHLSRKPGELVIVSFSSNHGKPIGACIFGLILAIEEEFATVWMSNSNKTEKHRYYDLYDLDDYDPE